jgi:hypothetical protein
MKLIHWAFLYLLFVVIVVSLFRHFFTEEFNLIISFIAAFLFFYVIIVVIPFLIAIFPLIALVLLFLFIFGILKLFRYLKKKFQK